MRNYNNEVVLFCGVDKKRLEITEGKHNLYLRCPKYKSENRNENEPVCNNRISYTAAHNVYSRVGNLDKRGELKSGIRFRIVNIECEVFEINDYYIGVYVINLHKVKQKEDNKIKEVKNGRKKNKENIV